MNISNGISIGSAVYVGLTVVINTHRHHATYDTCSNNLHPALVLAMIVNDC